MGHHRVYMGQRRVSMGCPFRVVFVPTLRVEIAAQTRPTHRVVPALTLRPSCRVVFVLCFFRACLGELHAASLHFFSAKHPSSKNSRSTKSMDLAPNSNKSMECLKGYSAKAFFVLTRGVGWKLPTTATHYTSVPVRFFFPRRPVNSAATLPLLHEQCRLLLSSVNSAAAALPSAGRPDRRRRQR
jgi:hypothetical protein